MISLVFILYSFRMFYDYLFSYCCYGNHGELEGKKDKPWKRKKQWRQLCFSWTARRVVLLSFFAFLFFTGHSADSSSSFSFFFITIPISFTIRDCELDQTTFSYISTVSFFFFDFSFLYLYSYLYHTYEKKTIDSIQ